MGNKGLLTVIAVVLIGIFSIMIIQMNEETPAEQISDSISNTFESIETEVN